ncbi:hypothetical protein Ais01nite_75470 [Asanoa ishikariensis]|uniref:hypothetical protein n=1 Tax=Asanoa ishikariensis TaxID=137265 RepID=UPI000B84438D|nr:hypothetical protein [Asanoa ishikariensis]GIF69512.1 hypothetical protein Ais01nite_75470 [Asanoa ishikariensis]
MRTLTGVPVAVRAAFVLWLLDGNSLRDALANLSAFGVSRAVHVAAVLAGCVLMYVPSANAYFRRVASPSRTTSRP